MDYIHFLQQWHSFGCFSVHQVKGIHPNFDRSLLYRWQKAGYIVQLRQQWYAFSDCLSMPDFSRYVAGQIYSPSYISLHAALAAYGIIPETVTTITSVTAHKTMHFHNVLGHYTYKTIRPELYFGYEMKRMADGRSYAMATPEKALLDLLYLYPEYRTMQDMLDLRLDDSFLFEDMDISKLNDYVGRMDCKALATRLRTLRKAYGI